MRFVRLLLPAIVLVVPAGARCQGGMRSDAPPDLVGAVRGSYAAIAKHDTSVLRRGLSDDFRWVLATRGQLMTKPQLIAAVAHAPSVATVAYEVDSVHVERFGDLAVIDYRLTDRRAFGTFERALVSRGTDTFVQHGRRWELLRRTQTWIVTAPATVTLDSTALRAFVGRYAHGANFIDDVHMEAGQLIATSSAESASGVRGAHLLPVSTDAFSPDGVAPVIVFERDASGRVVGYVQQSPDGSVTRARRLPDATGSRSGDAPSLPVVSCSESC